MVIRLYFDEDYMDTAVIEALRPAEIDVVTAHDAGMIERPDDAHLVYATEHGRVLCTHNASDFARLHRDWLRAGKHHTGLILVPQQRYSPGEQARRLLALMAALSSEAMIDRLEFLSSWDRV